MTEANNESVQSRKSRESENHAKNTRRQPWRPVRKLETPPAPEGYEYRWIRESMLGQEDRANVSRRLREGWEPVRADEYPDFESPSLDEGRYAGVIGVGGLILCRIPKETVDERSEYFKAKTRDQMLSVDNDLMKEEHQAMPINKNRQSRVTFGGTQSKD